MYLRTTPCRRASGSPGKLPAKITSALKALASRLTAAFARSVSLHTWAAVKATKSPKMMPSGGNMAGETALNARPHSPTARRATKVWIIPATRYVRPKTRRAIHPMGRLWTQSLMLAPDKRDRLISQQSPSGRPARGGTVETLRDTFAQVSPLAVWLARVALYFRFCLQPSQPQAAHCAIGSAGPGSHPAPQRCRRVASHSRSGAEPLGPYPRG